jgi:hypothetical protein
MVNVITLSECSCGIQKYARRFPERHRPGTHQLLLINLVQRRNRQDRTGLKILENNKNIIYLR